MKRKTCWLTTHDNPFDYFQDFTSWNLFDVQQGYNTCSLVDRILTKNNVMIESLTQKEIDEAIESVIDEIIQYDLLDIYKKIVDTSDDA